MADTASSVVHGSCLCGAVRYELAGDPNNRALCHCVNCKKWTGASFGENWWYSKDQFQMTTGSGNLTSYISSTTEQGRTVERFSCATCSSPLYITIHNRPQVIVVTAGSLDAVPVAPINEYFTRDRVGWISAVEGAKQGFD